MLTRLEAVLDAVLDGGLGHDGDRKGNVKRKVGDDRSSTSGTLPSSRSIQIDSKFHYAGSV